MSNSLDPDQASHFIGPDLGPNCFQRLPADDTSRQRGRDKVALVYTSIVSVAEEKVS